MTNVTPIIAIDGPSASGKGTIARKLAAHLGFAYLDTGLLYRAVGMAIIQAGGDPADPAAAEKAARALNAKSLGSTSDLRGEKASAAASKAAAHPGVRAALLKFQQDFASTPPDSFKGTVLDGRDIGTVIVPLANVKIYVTASSEARAERRFKELQASGQHVTYAAVLADMKERDAHDAERSIAPAKPADDAIVLDTTGMTAEQAFTEAVKIAAAKLAAQS